mmetsp:Transcript_25366/g.30061  ORF Transcript_25366/g.30061 Transcript_25366/m.30061 type:complete len:328 (-) Transcript_25366:161-1144(-)|eukprot:CAMPEP_0114348376 /NCGR_PEP_ID=MMETSP0101-20121206/14650_1 /TAXON_ID=38822 ORGANISM="Pteridomonas danica, Strain PT" /NCGR_SAMPLE_ID=MMETSP0101 /ASSEMBLY_ACC=CAM_ASM_000211 /LENGTH=327 /DNA_ID=CAMNT_0001486247 /DNA_START=13 /DNA_END=996 /DNA_ORIENTATION=-
MTIFLVPVRPHPELKVITLKPGLNVIGRAQGEKVGIAMTDYGLPKSLIKFISRKHVSIEILENKTIQLTALSSLQNSNKIIRLNGEYDKIIVGMPTPLEIGDKITLLYGAEKTFQTTSLAGDVEYIVSKSPISGIDETKNNSKITLCNKEEEAEVSSINESPAKRKRPNSKEGDVEHDKDSKETTQVNQVEATDTIRCPICMDVIVEAWAVNCPSWHNFCKECIAEWLKDSSTCPQCQKEGVKFDKGHHNVFADQTIELLCRNGVIEGDERERFEQRKKDTAARTHQATEVSKLSGIGKKKVTSPRAAEVLLIDDDDDNDDDVIDLC